MLKVLSETLLRPPPSVWRARSAHLRAWIARASNPSFIARRWLLLFVIGGLALAAATVSAGRIVRARALQEVRHEAQTTANLHAAVLRIELEKYRSVPFVMGSDAEVRQALEFRSAARSRSLDHKLAMLSKEVRVKVIYVLDATSFGIADSNLVRTSPENRLCGSSCKDRYYYTEAMRSGRAELFALGRADQLPGLYISHAIDGPLGRLGVAVVKVAFDKLEQEWGEGREPTFVTDRNGVVIISSVPQWRLTSLGPMSERVKAELAATGQFGAKPLPRLPVAIAADGQATATPGRDGKAQSFVVASTPLEGEGWNLHLMKPTSPTVEAAQFAAGAIAFLCGLLGLVTAAIFLRRDDLRRAEAGRQILARQDLEARVASRTSELSAANRRLTEEMEERRRMAETLQVMQDELVQANKLATLGQIAAGVAHEINQPVAAIKTYARNAGKYLGRDQTVQVAKNLGIIGDLTDRISVITNELRAFARRTGGGAADPGQQGDRRRPAAGQLPPEERGGEVGPQGTAGSAGDGRAGAARTGAGESAAERPRRLRLPERRNDRAVGRGGRQQGADRGGGQRPRPVAVGTGFPVHALRDHQAQGPGSGAGDLARHHRRIRRRPGGRTVRGGRILRHHPQPSRLEGAFSHGCCAECSTDSPREVC